MRTKFKDGYPAYLVRVDTHRMKILVNAESLKTELAALGTPAKLDEDDEDNNFAWVEFPGKFEVCDNCHGKGSHVNRAIDGNGLSQEDFDEDPDFREAYMSGVYDVSCDVCGGARVVLQPTTEDGQKAVADVMRGYYEIEAEYAAERRMGA